MRGLFLWSKFMIINTNATATPPAAPVHTPRAQAAFESFVVNLYPNLVRNESMDGKKYLVVPMVMIKEGVLEGSEGALFYPGDELDNTPAVWNMKPIVVYHPSKDGVAVSACDQVIINSRGIGLIMNANFNTNDRRLRAEAWLDEAKTKKVDNRILEAIEKKEMVELSTGLFTDNEQTSGEFEGVKYDAIARNYRPDHLAILPDQIGACSIDDGGGLLRLNQANATSPVLQRASDAYLAVIKANELSHSNIWNGLSAQISSKHGDTAWIEDVYDSFFIFSAEDKLLKQSYTEADNVVTISGETEEVVRVTEYRNLNGVFIGNARGEGKGVGGPAQGDGGTDTCICPDCGATATHDRGTPCVDMTCSECGSKMEGKPTDNLKGNEMKKDELIAALIANEKTNWTKDDVEFLSGLDEAQLVKMEPVENEEPPVEPAIPVEPVVPVAPAPAPELTADEYIANAPAGIRDMLASGIQAHEAQKAELVAVIVANESNTFTEENLKTKDLLELRAIANLAVKPDDKTKSPALYAAPSAPAANTHEEEPLVMATMDFEK